MPRNYQMKKTEYQLPHNIYMLIVYLIRDYDRLRREQDNIIHASPCPDSQPRGGKTSDSTADKAVKLAAISAQVDAIDQAAHDISAEYSCKVKRESFAAFDAISSFGDYGYFCYQLQDPKTEREPCRRTWGYFKSEFAYKIAQNLKLI